MLNLLFLQENGVKYSVYDAVSIEPTNERYGQWSYT